VAASWLRAGALVPAARALGITHFHAHFAAGANVAAETLARLTGTTFSFTMHAVDLYARPVRLCETLARARFGVTSTQYNQVFLAETCGPALAAKVALVRACVDPDAFAAVPAEPHDSPTVLSVGRLIEKKGHRDLVAAFAELRRREVPFEGLIVGDGPERAALEEAIARHGLGGQVRLVGSLAQAELRRLYGRSDLVALPSVVAADGDRDGIPVTLIEALAVGLPVVSTTVSGIPELVTADVGLLVPPHAPLALADALAALLTDADHRRRLGRAGPARVRAAFDVGRSAEQMARLFAGEPVTAVSTAA
jgi:glycosyltransferase involved in cell wall biosynthesis